MTDPVIPPGSVRFVIGQNPNKQIIVVEKEIVCKSPYFRKRLEPHRKAIEGNCPICQEALEEGVNEITYCASTCGNNFHQACIDAWKQSKPAGDTLQCPMCRQAFDIEGTYSIPELTPRGFRNFLDWLELNTVPPWDHSFYRAGRDSQDYIELIEAYFLGCFVKEHEFCKAAMQHLLKICWTHRSYPKWEESYSSLRPPPTAEHTTPSRCRLVPGALASTHPSTHSMMKYIYTGRRDCHSYPELCKAHHFHLLCRRSGS